MNKGKIDLGKPVIEPKKYNYKHRKKANRTIHKHRTMRGFGTFLILLLTSIFVGIISDRGLHKYAWIIALPVYGCSLLIYIFFLWFWHDDKEEEVLLPIPIRDIIHEHDLDLARNEPILKQKWILDDPYRITNDSTLSTTVDLESRSSMDDTLISMEDYLSLGFTKVSQTFASLETFFRTNIRQRIRHPHECITSTFREEEDGEEHDEDEVKDDLASKKESLKSPVWCHRVNRFFSSNQLDAGTELSIMNLSGKYKLIHNHNFDSFLKSQNIPFLIRNAANQARPIHTLTHDTTTHSLRIQVDGMIKGDTTYFIDGPPGSSSIRHLKFDDYVTYVDGGRAVQVRKVATNAPPNGATELIIKRTLANDGNYLLLFSKARFQDGTESVESIQTFHRLDHPQNGSIHNC